MKRILGIGLAAALIGVLFYTSRFWLYSLWPRTGLWGVELLRPNGDLAASLLRGTPFAPASLIIWGIAAFLVLSILQAAWSKIFKD